MEAIDADIWVLTETRESVAPADGYEGLHCPPLARRATDDDERNVSIWSRWPIEATTVPGDGRGSVSALVHTPTGDLVLYGTVIAWANDKGPDGTSRMWEEHAAEVTRQGAEWAHLRAAYPGTPMIVAGDFNQDRDGSGWYGTHHARELLTDELGRNDLRVVTDGNVVEAGLHDGNLVDHIAVSSQLATSGPMMTVMGLRDADGVRLSDHPTVIVDLQPSG